MKVDFDWFKSESTDALFLFRTLKKKIKQVLVKKGDTEAWVESKRKVYSETFRNFTDSMQRWKKTDFLKESSSKFIKLLVETLVDEIKALVTDKYEYWNRDASSFSDFYWIFKQTRFSFWIKKWQYSNKND